MPNLDEIKARREKITPGEWVFEQSIFAEHSCVGCSETGYALFESNGENPDDLIFCANAPSDIDWLVGEVERLQEALIELKGVERC